MSIKFKLVPVDPIHVIDMGWAYMDAARKAEPNRAWAFSHSGYRAMLAAAPLPPTDMELVDRTLVTRLQAEVVEWRGRTTNQTGLAQHAASEYGRVQGELTKAREVITALAKGFNTLDQVGGKYSISMVFSHRDDAWDAYNKLCKFNKLSRQTAPIAKDGA